jgi:hypothetical protein
MEEADWDLLLECLKPHCVWWDHFTTKSNTNKSMIVLYTKELRPPKKPLIYLIKLLLGPSKSFDRLSSAYIYWQDIHTQRGYTHREEILLHALRLLGSSNISEVRKDKYDIGIVCLVSLREPDQKDWQLEMHFATGKDAEYEILCIYI